MNKSTRSAFSGWIFDSYDITLGGLALYRIFCALFILLFALPPVDIYSFLGDLPADFYAPPPGPMMFFDSFPSSIVLLITHYLLIASLLFLLFGFFTKISSISTAVLLLILKGFIYSLGKINHDMLLAVVPLVMAFSGWGKAYSIDGLRKNKTHVKPQSWTLTLLVLIIGFMMFTAGLPKIIGGWLDIDTQATQGHYFKQFMVRGRQDLLAPYGQYIGEFWWEVFDYLTVIFEVGFLLAIINPKSTRIFICLVVLFHFGTMMFLNIAFLPNFIAYAAFLNWDWINEKIRTEFSQKRAWLPAVCVAGLMLLVAGLAVLMEGFGWLQSDLTIQSVIIVSCAVPVALGYLLNLLKR